MADPPTPRTDAMPWIPHPTFRHPIDEELNRFVRLKEVRRLERELAKAEESDRESIAMYHRARERAEQAEQRAKAAEAVVKLADELCNAVDAEAEDIGGHRKSLTILAELGPAVDAAIDAARKKDAA